ncbi:DUF6236 family protein [Streptomyces xanthochromogenes]|uniref:DUF6236 family protein n=1 Tax=Streptomyces xanthochromogenes TaxID=67384 RepID=UPI0034480208
MEPQTTQHQSTIALYYPWVAFQDDSWLKLALLAWDKIARIRPRGIGDADNDLVRQIRAETDLIMDITPSDADLAAVSDAFDEVISHSGFQFRFDLPDDLLADEIESLPPPPDPSYQGGGSIHVARDGLIWVYAGTNASGGGKANNQARGQLGWLGLAVPDPDDGPWLGMQPKVASAYLTVLADAIARHNQLCPVTDDPRAHAATGTVDRLAQLLFGNHAQPQQVENPESAYLHLALNAAIKPERLANLPIAKLIGFRRRYFAELAAFQQHVADLAPQLRAIAQVENVQVAQAHLQAIYDRTTKRQLDELRRALRGFGVESVVGTLDLKIDLGAAAGTVLGAAAAADGQLAVAGATAGVTVLPYLAQRVNQARRLKRESPVAYLLAADRKLSGSSLRRRR